MNAEYRLYRMAKEIQSPRRSVTDTGRRRSRNKCSALISGGETFKIGPPESHILTFSSFLHCPLQVIPLAQFSTDFLTWLLRDFSVRTRLKPVTPFSSPLDSKNKKVRETPLSLSAPSLKSPQIVPGSGIEHYFKDSPATCPIPSSFFPFLILPRSEDYAKQGMRVKGKFSG